MLEVTPRYLMQTLGTEWGRNQIHKDVWIRIMESRLTGDFPAWTQKLAYNPIGWVIDDVRFDNEAILIKRLGGTVFQIHREGVEYCRNHASEQPISPNLVDSILELPKHSEEIGRQFKRYVPALPRSSGRGTKLILSAFDG